MRAIYVLKNILHSGRKGTRGEPVDDIKYDGLIGLRVTFDIQKIKQFEPTRLYLLDYHRLYEWWDTSEILALSASNGKVEIETANSIYKLEEWKSKKEQEEKEGD